MKDREILGREWNFMQGTAEAKVWWLRLWPQHLHRAHPDKGSSAMTMKLGKRVEQVRTLRAR